MHDPTAPAALRCIRVSKRFGAVRAVEDASVDVSPGSILALLGPSGCGKTTTLRLIAGLETPDAGSIEIGGVVVHGPNGSIAPERRRVGVVFQEFALFPHLDVRRNVGFGLSRRARRDGRIDQVLRLVGLDRLGYRMPDELSGGQQQRVALARALAPDPQLTLLDEPFSNLDAALRVPLREQLRDVLRRAGATAVIVTHDQEEALSLADVVGVMMEGRLVQIATPEEIYRRPATRAVAEFIGDRNFVTAQGIGRAVVSELGMVTIPDPMVGTVDLLVRPEALRVTRDPVGQATVRPPLLRPRSGGERHLRLWTRARLPRRSRVRSALRLARARPAQRGRAGLLAERDRPTTRSGRPAGRTRDDRPGRAADPTRHLSRSFRRPAHRSARVSGHDARRPTAPAARLNAAPSCVDTRWSAPSGANRPAALACPWILDIEPSSYPDRIRCPGS